MERIVGEFLACVHSLMFSQYLVVISEKVTTQFHLSLLRSELHSSQEQWEVRGENDQENGDALPSAF